MNWLLRLVYCCGWGWGSCWNWGGAGVACWGLRLAFTHPSNTRSTGNDAVPYVAAACRSFCCCCCCCCSGNCGYETTFSVDVYGALNREAVSAHQRAQVCFYCKKYTDVVTLVPYFRFASKQSALPCKCGLLARL